MNIEFIKRSAFTLAETLLTLTIIGVLMAIMIRSITRVNPDQNKILFLKSYHSVETAVANIISDPSKYDQMTEENGDFSSVPLASAFANINGTIHCTEAWQNPDASKGETGVQCNTKDIKANNALCYFLAEQLNTIGGVSCSAQGLNFKTTNGVCFWDWLDGDTDGNMEAIVDPTCKDKNNGYVIKILKDGKMTVPESSSSYAGINSNGNQADAYRWIQDQTQIRN